MSWRRTYFRWTRSGSALSVALGFWLLQVALGALAAAPTGLAFSRLTAQLARGDAQLFEGGGLWLVELLRVQGDALGVAARSSLLLVLTFALAKLPALCLVVVSMSGDVVTQRPEPREQRRFQLLRRWLQCLPPFTLLSGLILLLRAIALGVLLLVVGALSGAIEYAFDEQTESWVLLFATSLCLLPQVLLQIIADLARSACAEFGIGTWTSARLALEHLVRRPWSLSIRWLGLVLLGLLGPLLAFFVADAASVSEPGSWRLWLTFVAHQLAFAWLVGVRLCWLSWCAQRWADADKEQQLAAQLGTAREPETSGTDAGSSPEPPVDIAERSAEQVAPTPSPDAQLGASALPRKASA